MNESILLTIHQHPIIVVLRSVKSVLLAILLAIAAYFLQEVTWAIGLFFGISILGISYEVSRWKSSALRVTTERIALGVRNGIFSSYELSIPFAQIKDIAYSRNHIFHAATGSGNIFLRSAAGKDGTELIAEYIPNVAETYRHIHSIFVMKPHERKALSIAHDTRKTLDQSSSQASESTRTLDDEIEVLKKIPGVTDVFLLTTEDKRFIFDTEEDRNHGVYEAIRRKYTLCFAHNADFRDPDEPIVFRRGTKIVFPAVSFHEITRSNTVSGSPGLEVHQYLFRKLRNPGSMDATVLVGFD